MVGQLGEYEGLTLAALQPGQLLNCKVKAVMPDGLLLTFLTYFTGTVNAFCFFVFFVFLFCFVSFLPFFEDVQIRCVKLGGKSDQPGKKRKEEEKKST